jgi:cellobiose-specific phosphotransferase system component IIA
MFVSTKMLTISAAVALIAATVVITSTTLPSPSPLSHQASGQESANKQLDQAIKALDSGDNAAAEGFLKEADNSTSGEAKMHVGEAMKALQANDTAATEMHIQAAQGLLQ